jgi:NTP pyrophosphatase (non-canonical NTP hydrolase)
MNLDDIQDLLKQFEKARGWDKFPASQVFAHLIEELGEISRHITAQEGYKVEGLGHNIPKREELSREFAQVFSLFLQLANHFNIDLEKSVLLELKLMKKRFPEDKWYSYMKDR